MMKSFHKSLVLAIASVAALSACNKEAEVVNPVENDDVIVLDFVSEKPDLNDSDTRTVYNPTTGFIDWSAGDKIKVGITVDGTWMAAAGAPEEGKSAKLYLSSALAEGGSTGVFNVSTDFTVAAPGTYKFYGLYPGAAAGNDAPSIPSVTISIPTLQVPLNASFDPAADVMVAVSGEYEGIPSDRTVDLAWTRVVAHGDITLTKLPEFASDETLQGLTISAQTGADLVGTHSIDLTSGEMTLPNNATAVNEIQIDTRNLTVNTTDKTLEFWFSSLPFTATSLKVVMNTNKKIYTKEYTGINLSFLANRRNTLSIGMKNATEVDINQLIANGEYVISCDAAEKMMAVGTEADDFRASVDLNTDTPTDDAIWTITYVAAQDAYRIYNADVAKYLFGHVGNEPNLKLCGADFESQSYTNLFKITESTVSGAYVITPLGNTTRKIGCNTGQPRFALYVGGNQQTVNLNIHNVSLDTTPRIEVVKSSVNMAKSEITGARTINTIKRKYFDGAITASSSADWLVVSNLAAGETEVKATIAANAGDQRTATVTLSADGIETKTFTVVQATGASSTVDVINQPLTGVTGTGYTTWSGKTSNSAAVYAGQSAANYGSVQLRNTNPSGIVTTSSGGAVKRIVVTWNSHTTSGRKLDIYGKNEAYEEPADLYNSSKRGTLLGSITCDTSTNLEIDDNYEFVGIMANGALYVDKIEITWGDPKQDAPISWSAETAEATLSNSGVSFMAPTLNGASGLNIEYESTAPEVASVDADEGTVTPRAAGTAEIKAIFDGNDAYKRKTVSYTLTVVDNRTFTITVNQPTEGGTISVSPSSSQKAGTVITLTANPATGYQLAEWIVTTASGSVSVNNNQFTMPAADVTITASFTEEGNPVTVSMTSFTEVSGNVGGDANVSYAATQGDAANAPVVNSSEIRIYQNGGLLTVTANNNKKITSVTIGSSMATTVQVKVDNGSFGGNNSISANGTYSKSDIEATTVVFKCTGTTKTSRLYLNSLSVTYK